MLSSLVVLLITSVLIIITTVCMYKLKCIKALKLVILCILYVLDIVLSFIVFVYSIIFYAPYIYVSSPTISDNSAKTESNSKHIVIIGYSFAGFEIHKNLQNSSSLSDYKFTIIEPKEYFEYSPAILEVITTPSHYKSVAFRLSQCFDSTNSLLIQGKVISIDNKLNCVTVEHINEKKKEEIKFDYCFICTGSKYTAPIKVNAYPEITKGIAYDVRAAEFKDLYHTLDCDCREQGHDCYVGIIGAGPVGIELMCGMVEEFPRKKVMLLDMADVICGQFPKSTQNYLMQWMDNYDNITLKLNSKIVNFRDILKPSKDGYKLKIESQADKTVETIPFDLVFLCAGFQPNSQIIRENKQFEGCCTDKSKGFCIRVDDWMRVINNNNIFAAGDVIDQPRINEVKLAHTAEMHAQYIRDLMVYLQLNNYKKLAQSFIPYHEWLLGSKITQSGEKDKKWNMPLVFTINLGKSDGSMGFGTAVYLNGLISIIVKWFIEVSMCSLYQRQSILDIRMKEKFIFKLYPIGHRIFDVSWKVIHAFTKWYIRHFNKI